MEELETTIGRISCDNRREWRSQLSQLHWEAPPRWNWARTQEKRVFLIFEKSLLLISLLTHRRTNAQEERTKETQFLDAWKKREKTSKFPTYFFAENQDLMRRCLLDERDN